VCLFMELHGPNFLLSLKLNLVCIFW
jgi:hypothetical protein